MYTGVIVIDTELLTWYNRWK